MFHKIMQRRTTLLLSLLFVLAVLVTPVAAQDWEAQITDFFDTFESLLTTVAASCAVIGFIGLAIMYLGSSFPLLADWKQKNPDASSNVIKGLILLIFVGGGGLAGMLAF
jgi:hypothetical protein